MSEKNSLLEGTQVDWRWSTHQPLNELILSVFKPDLIVELGGGLYSTPLFTEYKPKRFICIENDKAWFEELSGNNTNDQIEFRLHDVGSEIDKGTFLKDLTPEKKYQIALWYSELGREISEIKLNTRFLFVDNFTCCRNIALNMLAPHFDILAYHDCQPEGISWYGYNFPPPKFYNFEHYYLITPDSWTGVFIHKRLFKKETKLIKDSVPFCKSYAQRNNLDPKKVFLKRWSL